MTKRGRGRGMAKGGRGWRGGRGQRPPAAEQYRDDDAFLEAFLSGLGITLPGQQQEDEEKVTFEGIVKEVKDSLPTAATRENNIDLQMTTAATKLQKDNVAGALYNLKKAHKLAEQLVVPWMDQTLAALLFLCPPPAEVKHRSLFFRYDVEDDESLRFRTWDGTDGKTLNTEFAVDFVTMKFQTGDEVRLSDIEKKDGVTTALSPHGTRVMEMLREFFREVPEFPQLYLRLMRVRRTIVSEDKTLKLDNQMKMDV